MLSHVLTNRPIRLVPMLSSRDGRGFMKTKSVACLIVVSLCLPLTGCASFSQPLDVLPELTPIPNSMQTQAEDLSDSDSEYVMEDIVIESPQGYSIPTTVTLPAERENCPLVVLCHGFTGNRKGDGHFPRVAQQLAAQNVACVALDFAGNGDSDLPFTDYTLSGMYDDIETVIAYMRTNYSVSRNKLGLVGHSMGGRVVSLHLSDNVTAAALWSPANNPGADGYEFLYHTAEKREEIMQRAAADGQAELASWGVTISKTFLDEMAESDPCAALEAYQGSVLVAFAAGDSEILSGDTIELTLNALQERDLPFVDLSEDFHDATHNYTALPDSDADDLEVGTRIEAATVDFLVNALL